MWSTELIANGCYNRIQTAESSLEDLDDIDFNLQGKQEDLGTQYRATGLKNQNGIQDSRRSPFSRRVSDLSVEKERLHLSLSQPMRLQKSEASSIHSSTASSRRIRTVEISRTSSDPLGFYIRQGDGFKTKRGIYISRVTEGSLADKNSSLHIGDEILSINDVDMQGYCLIDVVQLIQAQNNLVLKIRSPSCNQGTRVRPGIYTRHSSPNLLKTHEKDLKKPIHSNDDSEQVKTNTTPKHKQKEQFSDKQNANDTSSCDLSKNTSTIDELIRLLRAHTEDQNCLDKNDHKNPKQEKPAVNITKNTNPIDINSDYLKLNTTSGLNCKKSSTITPVTSVDLLFDDDDDTNHDVGQSSKVINSSKPDHPYHRISITKPPESPANNSLSLPRNDRRLSPRPRSRTSSYGSGGSAGSSPRPRRRLPSLPSEDALKLRRDSASSLRSSTEHRPRRKLPVSPSTSPIGKDDKDEAKLHQRASSEKSTIMEEIDFTPENEHKRGNNRKSSMNFYQKNDEVQPKQQKAQSPSVVYRRTQSQYSDFYEQQRHSMFLQTVSSGKSLLNTTRSSVSSIDTESDTESTKSELLFNSSSASATLKVKSRESSPLMTRHASSSLLFGRKSRNSSPTPSRDKVESDPGFKLFPDEYKGIDLSCSHAVSGMMKARIIKAVSLHSIAKKKYKKIFCAVEVDFERKACTSQKKISKNITWDEVFDVEIQHGREMTFLCYGSKKEFDKHIARSSFFLSPLVRQSQAHQIVLRLAPEGLLYLELEFTEIKALLKRTPSSKKSGVFGHNLSVTSKQEHCEVPLIVRKCVEEIERRGLDCVGLYRISGNARRKEELKAKFEEDSQTTDITVENCPDIHIVTGILKDYLRELPEPLITDQMSQDLLDAVNLNIQEQNPVEKKKFLSQLVSQLPATNKNTLVFIMGHLCRVLANNTNKMDARNLSVCLAPVLQYSPTNLSQPKDLLGLRTFLKAVEVLIEIWYEVESISIDTVRLVKQ